MMVKKIILLVLLVVMVAVGVYLYYFMRRRSSPRTDKTYAWFQNQSSLAEYRMKDGTRCGTSPFTLPTDGLIGFIWDDSFRPGHRHSGIDIFGGTDVGITRIHAAYPGYLT